MFNVLMSYVISVSCVCTLNMCGADTVREDVVRGVHTRHTCDVHSCVHCNGDVALSTN
jgi:hypothetical protein